jgi:two-component system response regulator MprA
MPYILVIEDDLGVRAAMKELLESEQYDVTLAEDGRTALRLLEGRAYDLVMVDAFIPGMDGVETINVLRTLRPRMPIIVMSELGIRAGSKTPRDLLAIAAEQGADRSIRKPFGSKELLQSVRSCLDQDGRNVISNR